MNLLFVVLLMVWSMVAVYYLSAHRLSVDIMRWSCAVTLSCICAGLLARLFYIPTRKIIVRLDDTAITLFSAFRTQTMDFKEISACRFRRFSLVGGVIILYSAAEKIAFSSLINGFESMLFDLRKGLTAAGKGGLLEDNKYSRAEKKLVIHMLQVDRLFRFWNKLAQLAFTCALVLGLVSVWIWQFPLARTFWWMFGGGVSVLILFDIANHVLARQEADKQFSSLDESGARAEQQAFYGTALIGIILVLIIGVAVNIFL